MITILLLGLIYLAFISLGLPDSLLGVAWPVMRVDWGLPLDFAGLIAIPIAICTILSSLFSGYIIKKFGTGKVITISCLMTGAALLGFSFAPSYIYLMVLGIPLGFGAGAVDAALNNYVALHFKAHHMNWLHAFWGIGATLGPLIMSASLTGPSSWRGGYRTVSIIQLSLGVLFILFYPLWAKHKQQPDYNIEVETEQKNGKQLHMMEVFKIKGVKAAIATFAFYVAAEFSVGLWGSSFLVDVKRISAETAASWISLYYGGITLGRILSGFISFKLNNRQMIRLGLVISLTGVILLALPLPEIFLLPSLLLIGLGYAPIFPSMIHETPTRFGTAVSQTVIGYQMGFGYLGSTVMTPLIGVFLRTVNVTLFPFIVLLLIGAIILFTEKLNRLTVKKASV
ncbi:MAG TPA: MFS transporter [Thermotogota bacterium]|nr:MFS transporter [Thermotogota bacterium]